MSVPVGFRRAWHGRFEGSDGLVEFLVLDEKIDVIVIVTSFSFDNVVWTENEETLLVRKVFYERNIRDVNTTS